MNVLPVDEKECENLDTVDAHKLCSLIPITTLVNCSKRMHFKAIGLLSCCISLRDKILQAIGRHWFLT